MCLILLAWRRHPEYPLIVAANRDEFHARPSSRVAFWADHRSILAGRDLEAHGTWMGVSRAGRFAAVTNYRGGRDAAARESRGALVTGFLLHASSSKAFVGRTETTKSGYSGFNLLVADRDELWWLSNRDGGSRHLAPGIYGLGNLLLDTPEVADAKAAFEHSMATGPATESLLGVLAGSKIIAPQYGTRCSTVLLEGKDGSVRYAERAFDPQGNPGETVRYEFARAA